MGNNETDFTPEQQHLNAMTQANAYNGQTIQRIVVNDEGHLIINNVHTVLLNN